MVVKLHFEHTAAPPRFEYGVILNGSQTQILSFDERYKFEYGVILNGSQTLLWSISTKYAFEYGVILNGSQSRQK